MFTEKKKKTGILNSTIFSRDIDDEATEFFFFDKL